MKTSNLQPESFLARPQHIERSQSQIFDLAVVGGGITGAGVAREAAMRGLSVCLIEQADFGEGTSSRSSKLAHGGLRYLENFEFDLVSEALRERQHLLHMAPHMVKPLRFLMPLYKGDRVGPLKMRAGMILYDLLSAFKSPKFHEGVSKAEIVKCYPTLKSEGLKSGFLYSDALMDDDRLVHETLRSAVEEGAVVMSYVSAQKFQQNSNGVCELICKDRLSDLDLNVRAEHVVSCTGPWTDLFAKKVSSDWSNRMRPSKGIHITLPKNILKLDSAVVMAADKDKRILFCIPREGFDIVGTTDTDFVSEPGQVSSTKEDVAYILNILKEYYPGLSIGFGDILFSYSGVRPLVNDGSADESKVSRSHWVQTDADKRVTYISGGKYTTYLAMAEDALKSALKSSKKLKQKIKKINTRRPFVELNSPDNIQLAQEKLLSMTGLAWSEQDVLEFVNRHGALSVEFVKAWPSSSPHVLEALVAIHYYFCGSLKDFYFRRVPYLLKGLPYAEQTYTDVFEVFKAELGWSKQELTNQVESLNQAVKFETEWRS